MASLDNFTTGNGSRRNFPGVAERNRWLQFNLHSSQSKAWDIPSSVPVAPVQPYDPAMRTSSRSGPSLEEPFTPRSDRGQYVPLTPQPVRRVGDTVEGIQLYDPCPQHFGRVTTGPCPFRKWWGPWSPTTYGREVPLKTYSRYHPFLR